nr:MAG: hypothetical protein J07AB56_00520 [Candidatus Nanosalinarum sp. J07AB56]
MFGSETPHITDFYPEILDICGTESLDGVDV